MYVHIPFCQAICAYCNFNRGLLDSALKSRYVAALEAEIRGAATDRVIDSIFFGGGTPSLLDPAEVGAVLAAARQAFIVQPDAEVTLEINPETATPARLEGFLEAGVNRFSFGVQSFHDDELARLGRIHSAARAAEAVLDARRAGCRNISLDLMLWLPGQSLDSWRRTVDRAIDLSPDHLSMYLLELYPNAPLKEAMARAQTTGSVDAADWTQVADDEGADMYLDGLARLDAAGYTQYEISNVARHEAWSRHNLKYWQAGAWLGVGCGAHSTVDGRRWHNVSATTTYVERLAAGDSPRQAEQILSETELVQEALFTGLRLAWGIDRRNFARRFGVDPWTRYGEALAPYVAGSFLWVDGERFGLTRQGMLVANDILSVFV